MGDTIRCLQCYADVTVLRHPDVGSAKLAADATSKPVLNAGDGAGEHPTQALLDVFTMIDELKDHGGLGGKTIVLLGDLKHGRTVHSLAKLIARSGISNVRLCYCSPDSLKMPQEVKDYVSERGLEQVELKDLTEAIRECDVLYVTRVQKERFETEASYKAVKNCYVINKEVLKNARDHMVVMHPLPRVGEILEEVDDDPRAAYFRQMENGMFVRMAILAMVLGKR